MKITFLGTGTSQGVPVIGCSCEVCSSLDFKDNRLRSSIWVSTDDLSLVVDTGPDFRQQMLRERVQHLDAVLLTHEHKDHVAGLDDIRSFNFKQKQDMPVYARRQVIDRLKKEFEYIFTEKSYPGVPRVEVHEMNGQPFQIGQQQITPIEVMHYKLPVYGFRLGDFTYITDANFISEEEKEKIKGTRVLVLNALQKKPHISHFTLDEALALIDELKPTKAYLTHIGHYLGLHQEVSQELPENVEIAWDGLQIDMKHI